ncbi:prolyl hydroxylase family protein [Colwellia polaris]|uniref:prolyl hydroxylase family protein n=1 Tax=Colwellia polaris TaxID=326537 RepID=UPI001301D2DD|nr:2OG-Fe(II) oxygenase [Colwellia polaris]
MFLALLEDKHFGKLDPSTVFRLANSNAEFSNLWLVHSIRSDCSIKELALAVAANIHWDTPAIRSLEHYIEVESDISAELDSKTEEAITYSAEIINKFSLSRQRQLLIKLQTMTDLISAPDIIGNNKYTHNMPFKVEQLNNIITHCAPLLKDVSLFGGEGKNSKNENIRNNSHYPTPLPNDSMALALLENLLAKSAGIPITFAEPPVVLKYLPEQYYQWHYDHIYPHTASIAQHISQFGQRVKTAIFYLNDDFTGGETEFKTPLITVKPACNKVLIFDNCDHEENRDVSSIHRGKSVTTGEKWIVTLWFRNKPFWLRSGLL